MKNRLKILLLTAVAILCLALPLCAAQAVTTSEVAAYLGERGQTDVDYASMTINGSSTVANLLDWLDDFMTERVGYTIEASTDLTELAAAVTESGANTLAAADLSLANELLHQASDLNAQVQYYYDKLFRCYVQGRGNLAEIRSGELTADQQDEYARDTVTLVNENEAIRLETIKLINDRTANGWIETVNTLASALDADGSNGAAIANLRDAGFAVLRREAAALESEDQLGNGVQGPIIKVISDKEIAFAIKFTDANAKKSGIPIWVRTYDPQHPTDGKWRKAVTDDSGGVSFPVADFMPNKYGKVCVEIIYNPAEDSITMDSKGYAKGDKAANTAYQRRELGIRYMKGGDVFTYALPKADGKEYTIRATFNGHDMLNVESGMYITEGNDLNHTIALKMYTAGQKHGIGIYQYTGYVGWRYQVKASFPANSDAVQTYTEQFCRTSCPKAFVPGNVVRFEKDPRGTTLDGPRDSGKDPAGSFKAEKTKSEPAKKENQESPDLDNALEITVPEDWALIGGSKLKFPIDGRVSAKWEVGSSIQIAYNYEITPDQLSWKSEDLKEQEARKAAQKKQVEGETAKSKNGIASAYSAAKKKPFLSSAEASVTPYVYILATYEEKESRYDGSLNGGVVLSFQYEFTKQFMVGPVPAFIGAEFDFSLRIGFGIGASVKENTKTKALYGWDFSKQSGFQFNPHVELALTVGAGLPKLVYVALRGTGWLDLDVVLGHGDKPKVEVGLKAEVTVEVILWSKTWLLWKYVYPNNSMAQGYLLVEAMDGGATDVTTTLEQANAIADNYHSSLPMSLIGEAATETVIAKELPANGTSVKYANILVGNNQYANFAFWLGTAQVNGKATSRIFYMNLDDSNAKPQELKNQCSINSTGTKYSAYHVLEFDIDFSGDCLAICYMAHKNPQKPYPINASDDAYFDAMSDEQNNDGIETFACLYWFNTSDRTFWLARGENSSAIVKEVTERPLYNPRVRFLRDFKYTNKNEMYKNIVYGGVNFYKWEHEGEATRRFVVIRGRQMGMTYQHSSQYNGYQTYKHTECRMPDFQFLDFTVSKKYGTPVVTESFPAVVALTPNKKDPLKSTLSFAHGSAAVYVIDTKIDDCSMLQPVRERYGSSDRYQMSALLLLRMSAEKKAGKDLMSNKLSICYFGSRANDMSEATFRSYVNGLTLNDLGTTVSADGANSVNVRLASGANQLYAYWIQSVADKKVAGKNDYTCQYKLMACMIDTAKKAASPVFPWVTLQKTAAKVTLLPVYDVTREKMKGYYLSLDTQSISDSQYKTTYGLHKLEFPLTASASILSFATDYPVICQGKSFGMYFRIHNEGSLVLRSALIDVKAKKTDGNGANEVDLKGLKINFENPQENSVTQFDFPDASGVPTVVTGKHSIYPVFDVADVYAGNDVICEDVPFSENSTGTQVRAVKLFGLLPGGTATYKTTVTNNPMTWHGNYELFASIGGFTFTMGMSENDTVYTATRNANDSFTITYVDESGATQTLPDDALFSYFAQPIEKLDDNDNLAGATNLADTTDSSLYLTTNGVQTTDRVLADVAYNDLTISAERQIVNGVEYAMITLSNDAFKDDGSRGAGVVPMLNALIDGKIVKQISLTSELDGGFTRNIFLPLRELTGGKPYKSLQLLVTSSSASADVIESDDEAMHARAYKEVNLYANSTTIDASNEFIVSDPANTTVYEGQTATFSVTASGEDAPFTYQWYVVNAEGVSQKLSGANTCTLTLTNVPLAHNGLYYWCEVSDGKTILYTGRALLTVLQQAPVTGDAFPIWLMALLLSLSAATALLVLRRKRKA